MKTLLILFFIVFLFSSNLLSQTTNNIHVSNSNIIINNISLNFDFNSSITNKNNSKNIKDIISVIQGSLNKLKNTNSVSKLNPSLNINNKTNKPIVLPRYIIERLEWEQLLRQRSTELFKAYLHSKKQHISRR